MAYFDYIQKSTHLCNDRYVNVNQELDVVILDKESRKIAFFSGTCWVHFAMEMNDIDAAVQQARDGKPMSLKQHYGGACYMSVDDRVPCVDLRR